VHFLTLPAVFKGGAIKITETPRESGGEVKIRDPDVANGLRTHTRMGSFLYDRVKAISDKYEDDKDWGTRRTQTLADTLFYHDFQHEQMEGSYQVISTMQGLPKYIC
jgi:hypothetical protein